MQQVIWLMVDESRNRPTRKCKGNTMKERDFQQMLEKLDICGQKKKKEFQIKSHTLYDN